MKKIYTLLIALTTCFSLIQAAVVNGTCGDNLTWSLNTQDSTLTIEGTGPMYNFNTISPLNPWNEYKSYIVNVNLPDGLTHIGGQSFVSCQNLREIIIPNTVVSIGEDAFEQCSKMTSIEIPNSVTNIGRYAFLYCTGLTSITIPENVTSMGLSAFSGCNKLTTVYWNAKDCYCDDGYTHTSGGSGPFSYCSQISSFIIGQNVRTIPGYLCYGFALSYGTKNLLTSVNIPASVTQIGKYAFTGCAIDTITIPDNVTSIGERAFMGCSLTSIKIGNNVTSLSTEVFGQCSKLTTVVLGSSISTISTNAFQFCPVSSLTISALTPPTGAAACGINPSECTLYVPEESVNTYRNTIWWEDFATIRAIGSKLVVTFIDWDGQIISTDEVEEGGSATPPSNPTREGYSFIGWDKDFSNVTEDLIVTALYKINRYKVDFVDWNNTLLKSDSVDWNTAAIAPTNPYRKGYTFTGWNKNFEHITSDETIMAQYEMGEEKDVTVLYTNGNDGGTILSHSVVLKMPEAPEIEGFTFLGWQPKAEFIDEIIEIQAIYKSDSEVAPQVVANPSNPSQKLIRNGNVYILTGNKTYTITGAEVK